MMSARGLRSPRPPARLNAGIIRQPEFPFIHCLSFHSPPFSAALRLKTIPLRQLRLAYSLQKSVTSDELSSPPSNPVLQSPNPDPIHSNGEPEVLEGEGVKLSGSDVLWALKNATLRKKQQRQMNKTKNKKTVLPENSSGSENPPTDSSKFKPLKIKRDWGERLEGLEQRLKELPQII